MSMASFWYKSILYCVIQALCLYHAVSSECDIIVSEEIATVGSNGNLSVLCDASCMVGDDTGSMVWYDNQYNQVSQSGRVFSVSYGRGRYSRLVILNAIPTDEGNYICTLEANGEMEQKSFTLIYNGPTPTRSNIKQDIGPRRGDVVIYDPIILHRRPKRGIQGTTTLYDVDNNDDGSTTIEATTQLDIDNNDEPEPESEPTSTQSMTRNEAATQPTMSTTTNPTTTTQTTRKPTTTTQTTTVEKSKTQKTTTKSTQAPQKNGQGTPKPVVGGNSKVPNTQFGRSGLVAFVVSLSIALLLLYALVLILVIPMCLKRKKGRTSTKRRTQTAKDTPIVLSQIAKSEDNGDLPSPGPSDAGFTTIDLDDPPKDKQGQASEQKQNDDVTGVPSAKTDPETANLQESMLGSVMSASDKGETKPVDPAPVDDDLKFIDETTHSPESQKLDDSSVFDNSTPIGEPQIPTTETTEVKLEITEKEDGQKQIKLSSSSPPPEAQSISSQSSN